MDKNEDSASEIHAAGDFTIMMPEYYARTKKAIRYNGAEYLTGWNHKAGVLPMILHEGRNIILDPRSIVFNETEHTVIYSPRGVPLDEHKQWVRDWLKTHPNWGIPGCEKDWDKAVKEIKEP